jgi:hypothetical protein
MSQQVVQPHQVACVLPIIVQFLWATKLRSRDSFLFILQFIDLGDDLTLGVLRDMFLSLNPNSYQFFLAYVRTRRVFVTQVRRFIHRSC